jgi:hypothetical protein
MRHQLNFLNNCNYNNCKLNWIEPTWVFNVFEFDESVVRSRVPIGQNPKSVLWAKLQGFVKTQLHLLPTKKNDYQNTKNDWRSLFCFCFLQQVLTAIFSLVDHELHFLHFYILICRRNLSLFLKTVKFYPLSYELIGIFYLDFCKLKVLTFLYDK